MTSFTLKLIAIVTMLIDHIGSVFFPYEPIFRIIGRISFPIFCFLIVEGFIHTSSFNKYAVRLGIFAVISEIPYDMLFFGKVIELGHQNIFFELLAGLFALYCLKRVKENKKYMFLIVVAAIPILAECLHFSYGAYGILMIISFYLFRENNFAKAMSVTVQTLLYCWVKNVSIQAYSIFAFIPLYFYNGKKGASFPKLFFYLFYPAHLLALFIVRICFTLF